MAKKRDVVITTALRKKFGNVIDLQQFKADRERASLVSAKVTDESVRKILAWLPTMDELEAPEHSLRRMLSIKGLDQRTFFGIGSNTEGEACSFFGAESADGATQSLSDLEWFIVGHFEPGKPPAVVRQTDLEAVAASKTPRDIAASPISIIQPLVREE